MEGEEQVRNWLKKYDIITKVLSLLAALVLWMYVMGVENPSRTLEYSGIHVQLLGADKLFNAYNLSIIDGEDSEVTLKITDKSDQMAKLTSNQIKITADLTKYITSPGKYSIPYDVVLPVSSMRVENKNPATIEVVVDKIVTKSIPVELNVSGTPANGFIYEEAQSSHRYVSIEGPDKEIAQIQAARVDVSADKLSATQKTGYEYALINSDGNEVRSENISRKTPMVTVTLPVKKLSEVPLKVTLLPSASVDSSLVTTTITPETVKILGDAKAVDSVSAISVGSIDLAKAKDGEIYEFPIKLPSGIKLAQGQPAGAKVQIKIDGLVSRQFSIGTIQIEDTSSAENKKLLTLKTQTLTVTVKGQNSALSGLSENNIHAIINLDSSKLEEGQHTLPVTVTVTSESDVTVEGSYTASVEVGKP